MTVENKTKKVERCGHIVMDQLLCKMDSIRVRFMVETSEEAICGNDFPLQKLKVFVSSKSDLTPKTVGGATASGEIRSGILSLPPPMFPPLSTHCGDQSGMS